MENGAFLFWNQRILPFRRDLTDDLSAGVHHLNFTKLLLLSSKMVPERTLGLSIFCSIWYSWPVPIWHCLLCIPFHHSCLLVFFLFLDPTVTALQCSHSRAFVPGGFPFTDCLFGGTPELQPAHINNPQVFLWVHPSLKQSLGYFYLDIQTEFISLLIIACILSPLPESPHPHAACPPVPLWSWAARNVWLILHPPAVSPIFWLAIKSYHLDSLKKKKKGNGHSTDNYYGLQKL